MDEKLEQGNITLNTLGEFKGLSETEHEIMELLWEQEEHLSFAEILSYFNEVCERGWKKQTLSVFLARLGEKGMVHGTKKGRTVLYAPRMTLNQYETTKANSFLTRLYQGSVGNFLTALTLENNLSKENVEELKQWLEDNT